MISSKIENAIIKFMNRSATASDLELLEKWITSSENKKVFEEYVQDHYAINYNLNAPQAKEALGILLDKIRKEKSVFYKVRMQSVLKYAAIVLFTLGIGYLYQGDYFNANADTTIIIPNDKITLVLPNGEVEHIVENDHTILEDERGNVIGTQQGNQLQYTAKETTQKTIFNTINVPYGKKFTVALADGTTVHLNAGTRLRYPTSFVEGQVRKVFLKGEAYFDVAKDEKHPFIVNIDEIDVRVLGTQFNVSAYGEDKELTTVLVEGAVRMYDNTKLQTEENGVILSPNQKGTWYKLEESIDLSDVDVSSYISWVQGKLVFKNTPFSEIIKKLERHYNVEIVNNNLLLDTQYYDATFDIETIQEVLKSFNKSYAITYTISDNKIIIN